jgi:hypothetical protein
MIDEALRKLRLDRRLTDRRGWIPHQELARELAALPDVSDKVAPPEAEPEGSGSEAAAEGGAGGSGS